MTRSTLPFTPAPFPDEMLSSWIERIGIFYDVGYAGALAVLAPDITSCAWGQTDDFDADAELHRAASEWSGRSVNRIPALLDSQHPDTLDINAREGYCPACWDDDVARGGVPYVRRRWATWTAVSCDIHRTWLAARHPRNRVESRVRGWGMIWQSKLEWARALDQRVGAPIDLFAKAFAPDTFDRPQGCWDQFERTVHYALGRAHDASANPFAAGSLLAAIVERDFEALRRSVKSSLQIRPAPTLIDENTLKGYTRAEPGWIANRISCIVLVAELARIAAGRSALFPRVRPLIEASDGARVLLMRTRDSFHSKSTRRAVADRSGAMS